mgnify:CR=1 FL=1
MTNWISSAIKRPGKYRKSVQKRYGKKGFDKKGRIKNEILIKDSKKKGSVGRMARLSKTLRKLSGKSRRFSKRKSKKRSKIKRRGKKRFGSSKGSKSSKSKSKSKKRSKRKRRFSRKKRCGCGCDKTKGCGCEDKRNANNFFG